MNAEKFTPGPWMLQNEADVFTKLGAANRKGLFADTNDAWLIADCNMEHLTDLYNEGSVLLSTNEIRSNAHLIVAAPDMYNLLKELAEDLDNKRSVSTTKIYKMLMKARGEFNVIE